MTRPVNPSQSFVPVDPYTYYETVAASQSDQALGITGASGDYIYRLILQATVTNPGNVILKDNTTAIYTFPGGAGSGNSMKPIVLEVGAFSRNGAWKVTTGANIAVLAVGRFKP